MNCLVRLQYEVVPDTRCTKTLPRVVAVDHSEAGVIGTQASDQVTARSAGCQRARMASLEV